MFEHGGPSTLISLYIYGGIKTPTLNCILRDISYFSKINGIVGIKNDCEAEEIDLKHVGKGYGKFDFGFCTPRNDALIDRARAFNVKYFLEKCPDMDVLIMIDHDIEWAGFSNEPPYEGDLCRLARKAKELNGIVGAVICKKAFGEGDAIFWKEEKERILGSDEVAEVEFIGSAFTAYSRECLQTVYDSMEEVDPGFKPIFLPMMVPNPVNEKRMLHLSEDWAFCRRAKDLGFKSYADMRCLTLHHGEYAFGVIKDGQPEAKKRMNQGEEVLKISLLHATRGRPEQAAATAIKWRDSVCDAAKIEHIISVDDDDESDYTELKEVFSDMKFIRNKNRGNVDAWNAALYESSGHICVQMHDDLYPPKEWDRVLGTRLDVNKPQILHTSDGNGENVNPSKPWLVPILIGTTKYFKECGYFFCPDYISVFCDDDSSMKSRKDDVVIEAFDVEFKHAWGGADGDETYKRSYSKENWTHGQTAFNKRLAAGFPNYPERWPKKDESANN